MLKRQIEFLGYEIQDGTIRPSPDKTKDVKKIPEPKNDKQIQSFLGLAGYFRKFIEKFASIAKPLSDLLRNGVKFQFNEVSHCTHLKSAYATGQCLQFFAMEQKQNFIPMHPNSHSARSYFNAITTTEKCIQCIITAERHQSTNESITAMS